MITRDDAGAFRCDEHPLERMTAIEAHDHLREQHPELYAAVARVQIIPQQP